MFKVTPTDESWTSSEKFEHRMDLPASPEDVFEVMAGKDEEIWFPGFKSYKWMTPPPHGKGSVREYVLTSLRLTEIFLVWEPGQRLCFTVSESSLPYFRRFKEDYRMTPTDDGHTSLTWTVFYEGTWWLRPIGFIIRALYKRTFDRAAVNIHEYFADKSDRVRGTEERVPQP